MFNTGVYIHSCFARYQHVKLFKGNYTSDPVVVGLAQPDEVP